ncbi:MAG: acetylornithine deacetylase [Rhodothermales bacterium]|jgi:acetylornithine deacetylase
MSAARHILETLVKFESLSGSEKEVADALTGIIEAGGLQVNRVDDNIWCALGDGPDGLLLNSHLDVVPASEGHPYPPFSATVVDGWLYGRGSVDAKGCVAAMTAAILELAAEGWAPEGGRLVGAFTSCEESGWPYNGLEKTRPSLPPLRAAIVGEPTDLQPCIAQKGLLILKLEVTGVSAHAARPHLGQNAVVKAAADVTRLASLEPVRVHPVLGPVTVTPTVISGGKVRNMIPDACTVHVDVRSTPAYTHAELVDLIQDAVEGNVVVHSDRLISVDTAADARIVSAAVKASGGTPFGSPTASDWIFLSDLEAVKMGPGSSNLSHTAGERQNLGELDRAVKVYKDTILAYFR